MIEELESFVAPPKPTPEQPLRGLTVLAVEDSRFASEALRLLCVRSGARLRRADSLRAARRHLGVYRPAVVIVDAGLPDGSGLSLIEDLATAVPRVQAIIAISGDPCAEAAALAAGADGFLQKPVESAAMFQQCILQALPERARQIGPRRVDTAPARPGDIALNDDLAHAQAMLSNAGTEADVLDYLARFLLGLGRQSGDAALERAGHELARARSGEVPAAATAEAVAHLLRTRLHAAHAI